MRKDLPSNRGKADLERVNKWILYEKNRENKCYTERLWYVKIFYKKLLNNY
jgi:hypothetical protein